MNKILTLEEIIDQVVQNANSKKDEMEVQRRKEVEERTEPIICLPKEFTDLLKMSSEETEYEEAYWEFEYKGEKVLLTVENRTHILFCVWDNWGKILIKEGTPEKNLEELCLKLEKFLAQKTRFEKEKEKQAREGLRKGLLNVFPSEEFEGINYRQWLIGLIATSDSDLTTDEIFDRVDSILAKLAEEVI